MSHLEVIAHLKIRPGQLDRFKAQVAEIMRLSRQQDTQTLRYDWFINEDGTECEVHEAYVSEEGLIEHNAHVMEARAILFDRYAYDHRMSVYGEISQPLRDLFSNAPEEFVRTHSCRGLSPPPRSKRRRKDA